MTSRPARACGARGVVSPFACSVVFVLSLAGCDAASGDPDAAAQASAGEAIWQANCRVCHLAGLAGAPKLGDRGAWAPRIAQGEETLITHALDGHQSPGSDTAMPARGGKPDLGDDEIAAAVRYMVSRSR